MIKLRISQNQSGLNILVETWNYL